MEDVALRFISRDTEPHFTSIALFRRTHLAALAALFGEVLRLCRLAGLVRGVNLWLDGTKVKANASKHKAMSYEGMKEREARLAREIDELLQKAEQADATEDAEFGPGREEADDVAAEESNAVNPGRTGSGGRERPSNTRLARHGRTSSASWRRGTVGARPRSRSGRGEAWPDPRDERIEQADNL